MLKQSIVSLLLTTGMGLNTRAIRTEEIVVMAFPSGSATGLSAITVLKQKDKASIALLASIQCSLCLFKLNN
jgi:hypothetical protein